MTDSPSVPIVDSAGEALRKAIGSELQRVREEKGLARSEVVGPPGPSTRTLVRTELGQKHILLTTFVDLCLLLDEDPSALMRRALQRAGIAPDKVTLGVDLRALLRDKADPLFLHPWARDKLSENRGGVVEVSPMDVKKLSHSLGCPHQEVATYLATFYPTDATQDERGAVKP